MHLESRNLAPGTVNLRLGAVRRLAYEAADCGLLSSDLAAGIRRVKGVKKIGVRLGNWLTSEQSQPIWHSASVETLKASGTARSSRCSLLVGSADNEAVDLNFCHLQQCEEHWAII